MFVQIKKYVNNPPYTDQRITATLSVDVIEIRPALNGQRASDKRANSFWCWALDTIGTPCVFRMLTDRQGVPIALTVLSVFKLYTLHSKSFLAQWLVHWPQDPGIVRSNPRDKHFPQNKSFFFISLSFFLFFLTSEGFEVNNVRIYIESTTILDLQWKLFLFSKWLIPHRRAKQDTLRGYQAFYSRYNAFFEMKMTCTWWQTLYVREKERFVVLATFRKNG